jgi:RimJ/RimL family protein N-acetyltransferase
MSVSSARVRAPGGVPAPKDRRAQQFGGLFAEWRDDATMAGALADVRVRLRPLRASDAKDHVRWRNDPEVRKWATASDVFFGPVTDTIVERVFADKLLTLDPRTDAVFSVELADGRHIGMVDYRDVNAVARSCVVGITIGEKDLWGQGYGTEALGILVEHLFGPLNLRRVQLDTWSGNERAIRAFTRLGFREEGRLRQAVRGPDGYYDLVVMGLLRHEWARSSRSDGRT